MHGQRGTLWPWPGGEEADTAVSRETTGVRSPGRASIRARTLRTDRWWAYPLTTFAVLLVGASRAAYADATRRRTCLRSTRRACRSTAGRCRAQHGAPYLGWFGTWWIVTPGGDHPDLPAWVPADLLLLPQGLLPVVVAVPAGLRGRRAAPPLYRRDPVPAAGPERPPVFLLRRAGLQRDPDLGTRSSRSISAGTSESTGAPCCASGRAWACTTYGCPEGAGAPRPAQRRGAELPGGTPGGVCRRRAALRSEISHRPGVTVRRSERWLGPAERSGISLCLPAVARGGPCPAHAGRPGFRRT